VEPIIVLAVLGVIDDDRNVDIVAVADANQALPSSAAPE